MTTAPVSFAWRRTINAVLTLAFCFPGIAFGQDGQARFEAADRALNENYRAALKLPLPPAAIESLKVSQRAWLAYRDASANLAAMMTPDDPQAAARSNVELTQQRANALKDWVPRRPAFTSDRDDTALATADRELNEVYDVVGAGTSPGLAGAIRDAQRAWVASREADVAALTAFGILNSPGAVWSYLRTTTQLRSYFLSELIRKTGSPKSKLAEADAALNKEYRKAIGAASSARAESLKAAQRAWLTLRDANAALASALLPDDPDFRGQQLINDTKARERELMGIRYFADVERAELGAVERELDHAYQVALAELPAPLAESLRASQDAWLKFRAANEALLLADQPPGSNTGAWSSRIEDGRKRIPFLHHVSAVRAYHAGQRPPAYPANGQWTQFISDPNVSILPAVAAVPPPAREVVTRMSRPEDYFAVALDMKENLLVGSRDGVVDFWDVQTGAMIQRIALNGGGWFQTLNNLGQGHFVVAGNDRRAASLTVVHRDADEPLYQRSGEDGDLAFAGIGDAASPEAGRLVCRLDVAVPRAGKDGKIEALTPDSYETATEARFFVVDRGGSWRPFLIPPELQDKVEAWAVSPDGSQLLWMTKENSGSRALTLSLPECRLLRDQRLPESMGIVRAACAAKESWFLQTSAGALWRFDAERGSLSEGGPALQVPQQKSEDDRWVRRWLCGTRQGWCLYGSGMHDERDENVNLKSYRTLASTNAPDHVRKLLKAWNDVHALSLDRGGEYAAVADREGLALYHLPSGQIVRRFGLAAEPLPAGRFSGNDASEDGRYLTTWRPTKEGGLLDILDLAGVERHRFQVPGGSIHFGGVDVRLGRVSFSDWGHNTSTPKVFDLRSGKFLSSPMSEATEMVPPGKFAAEAVIADRHPATHQRLVYERGRQKLTLLQKDGRVANGAVWSFANDSGYNQFDDFRFDHGGRHVLHEESDKFTDTLSLLDLRVPGKTRWWRSLDGHANQRAFSPDDQTLLIASEHDRVPMKELQLLRTSTGDQIGKLAYRGKCVGISDDASRAFIELWSGGYQVIEQKDGRFQELVRYLPGPGESFVLLLPSGHYLTLGNALPLLAFAKDGRSQPAESFDIKYNRPDLVAKALGAAPELVQAFRRSYEKRLRRLGIKEQDLSGDTKPPVAAIDYIRAPLTTSERVLRLPVELKPGGAPLAALEVTMNDVPVLGRDGLSLRGKEASGFAGEVEIELASGNNKITVWARDAKGLTSSRVSVNVTLTTPAQKLPTLYVLAVGINQYLGDIRPLTLAKKDALDIARVFTENAGRTFAEVKTMPLLDHLATRRGILDARSFFAEAGVEDQVVIFMSAHGVLDAESEYRFCSADTDLARLPETTLTFREIESLLDGCRARKRIILLDTCHAGEPDRDEPLAEVRVAPDAVVKSVPFQPVLAKGVDAGNRRITDLLQRHFVDLRIGAGAAVLSSSTAQQESLEAREINNGLFTAAVITGLTQNKTDLKQRKAGLEQRQADLNGDGKVLASELLRFCQEEVKRLSEGRQDPVARHVNLAEDFPVLIYRQAQ
ncbi:MAG: hypothetical protein QOE70_1029 [Chthoniobacter sp.]|jgi:uncharacterized protein YecT (DUF1311 family)|nr:hypothetical protein [Chthoniobacter sp.]